jgi:hypothetical protein
MTNEKFSMTDFQFRRSALVAALPCCALAAPRFCLGQGQTARPTRVQPYSSLSQSVEASSSDFFWPNGPPKSMQCTDNEPQTPQKPLSARKSTPKCLAWRHLFSHSIVL